MRLNVHSKRRVLEGLGIAAAATILRLLYTAPYPTGWDDVDFALALAEFDMSRMQPHFPGYPIYIAAARLVNHWLADPFLALSVLSGVAGGLTILPLWLLFNRLGSVRTARLGVWLFAVAPLPLITSIQPMSDSVGACMAAWLAYFAWRAGDGVTSGYKQKIADGTGSVAVSVAHDVNKGAVRWLVLAGITVGLLLGVRISYIALAALWLWAVYAQLGWSRTSIQANWQRVAASAAAVAAVCIAWLLALVATEGGFDKFFTLAVAFTGGHFSDWGGTYHTDSSLLARLQLLVGRQIGAAGMGTVWQGDEGLRWIPTLFVGIAVAGAVTWFIQRKQDLHKHSIDNDFHVQRKVIFLCIWAVPYLIWVLFAQNVDKPRHILPLLPPLLYLAAAGVDAAITQVAGWFGSKAAVNRICGMLAGGIWLCSTLAVSLPLLQEASTIQSPMVQLAHYVNDQIPANHSLIFTWEEQRVLKLLDSSHTVIRLRHWEDLRTEALQYDSPQKIYATNALIDGLDRPVTGLFREVAVFRGNAWLYPTYNTIRLYEGTSQLYEELR